MRPLIVSGGQTGVDRAALDVAVGKGLPYSGWCPLGGRAEDFPNPPGLLTRYALRPTPAAAGEQRTAWNVRDSHATLIILNGPSIDLSKGTLFTKLCADLIFLRPCRVLNLDPPGWANAVESTTCWLIHLLEVHRSDQFSVNFAGPREKESPGIYRLSFDFIDEILSRLS